MKSVFPIFLLFTLLIAIGCSTEEPNDLALFETDASSLLIIKALSDYNGLSSKRDKPPIWADCIKYRGVVTPANFKPESDPFDELYMMPNGDNPPFPFFDGLPLISDSKPGDQDYNGGRWHLNVLKEGVDPYKYMNVCSEEGIMELDPDDFVSTEMYFACPLIKFK